MAKVMSLLDRKLLDAAASGATPQEMEEQYGVPAAQAVVRVKDMLAGITVWDEIEQRQLRIQQLQTLYRRVDEFGINPSDPKMMQALTNLIGLMDKINSNDRKINDDQLRIVSETHAKALLGMIEMAYMRARNLLEERYTDVPLDEIDEAFHEGLREASKQIEA